MGNASSPNVTQLLVAWGKGDRHAFDALMPEVRKELHRLAAHYMAEERPGHDLQPTALINEAYLRLVDWKNIQWADRAHFFAMAANMMRRVLVDHARNQGRVKRGGEAIQVSFVEAANVPAPQSADVLALDKVAAGTRGRRSEKESDRGDAFLRRIEPGRSRGSPQRFCRDRKTRLEPRTRLAVSGTEEE